VLVDSPGRKDVDTTRRVGLALLAMTLLLTPAASVQESDDERPQPEAVGGLQFVDEVRVTVVNVDVFVHDKKGKPVTGLTRDDFRIYQDGEQRVLSHFAQFTEEVIAEQATAEQIGVPPTPTPEAQPEEVVTELPELKPIYIVLYVDSENLRPFDRNRVLSQVRRFINDIMYPHVQVMVVSHLRSVTVEQPFTNNKRAVMDSIRSLFDQFAARPSVDTQRARLLRDLNKLREQGPVRSQNQAGRAVYEVQGDIQSYADEMAVELEFTINAIRGVTTSMSGFPGRKWLVYISNGLPMVPGRDLFHDFGDIYQASSQLTYMMRYNKRYFYENLASTANAQGVTFLTIDASGLGATGGGVSAEHQRPINPITDTIHLNNMQESLQYMAERTGGRAILSANDVTAGLESFRSDLFTFYSLGYTLSSSGSDKVHRIKVELPDHPDYQLSYRRSFVEKSPETRVQDAVVTGLMYDLESNPMKIRAEVTDPTPADKDRWILPLEVRIPLRSIALIPELDEYVGQIMLVVAAQDKKGRQSDLQRREHEIRMPAADYETRRGDHIVVELDLLMNEGFYRVAVGVMDRITRQSSYQSLNTQVP
jgi:VWFA-related protein